MIHVKLDPAYRNSGLRKPAILAAQQALILQGKTKAEVSVVLTGDKTMKKLNRQFRGFDQPTDVLSFPSAAAHEGDPGYLGDVVISVVRARQQAKSAGHSLSNEVQLLTVHGVLHLLGYDHSNPSEKAGMWAAQDEVLARLGVSIDVDQAVDTHLQG